jgi:hypothetical protein
VLLPLIVLSTVAINSECSGGNTRHMGKRVLNYVRRQAEGVRSSDALPTATAGL